MSEGFNQFRREVSHGLESKKWTMKSAVAILLFGAIIMVFIFFGFPGNNQGAGGSVGSAAVVNKTLISFADLRSEAGRLEQMYAPMFGGNFAEAQRQFINQQALETLINQELIYQIAAKAGVLSTDHEVHDIITNDITAFQKNGRFQKDLYFGILQANRLTPEDFELKIRKERTGMRAQKLFEASAVPSELELQKIKTLKEQKINVQFARVDKETVISKMNIAGAEVEKRMSDLEFGKQVQEYYNANKPEFNTEAQVKAQHILIKITPNRKESDAKAEIERIAGLAKAGDFGKLASQFSEDEGSKKQNGELGYFSAGKMVPEFEQAAFAQKVGDIGAPVKTQFGYHLIKVTDKKEAGQKSFDEVKKTIAQKLMASQVYENEMKTIEEALAKKDLVVVEQRIKVLGLDWSETGVFDLSVDQVPGITSSEATKAVLTLDENNKVVPSVVKDGPQRFVLKLKEYKKEAVTQVGDLRNQITRERAMDDFKNWVESNKKSAHIERGLTPQNM